MNKYVKMIMENEGMTQEEAESAHKIYQDEIKSAIEDGYYMDAEEMMAEFYGIEPDDILDFI